LEKAASSAVVLALLVVPASAAVLLLLLEEALVLVEALALTIGFPRMSVFLLPMCLLLPRLSAGG